MDILPPQLAAGLPRQPMRSLEGVHTTGTLVHELSPPLPRGPSPHSRKVSVVCHVGGGGVWALGFVEAW